MTFTKKISLALIMFSLSLSQTYSQNIQGPSPVGLNSTHTYNFTDGFPISNPTWIASKGVVQNTWSSGVTYYVTVRWTATGTGSLKLTNVDGQLGLKSIVINSCSAIASPIVNGVSRCATGPVVLTATVGSGGTDVRWYGASTDSPILATGTSFTTPQLSSTTSYRAASYDPSTGCESGRATVFATINPIPEAPTVTNSLGCGIPTTVTLSGVPGTDGNTLRWYDANTGGNLLATSSNFLTPQLSSTATYYVSSFNSNTGCESISSRVSVIAIVNSMPNIPVVSGTARFGSGTLMLTATGAPSDGSYKWYDENNLLLNTSSAYTTQVLTETKTNLLYIKSYSADGCVSNPAWVTVSIYPIPIIVASRSYIVKEKNETLDGGPDYDSYSWKNNLNIEVSSSQTLVTNKPGIYYLTVTKGGLTAPVQSYQLKSQFEMMDGNYIVTNTFNGKTTNIEYADSQPVDSVSQTVQYFDGIGRPIQYINTQISPTRRDLIQPFVYDVFGREARKYLPFSAGNDGLYKKNEQLIDPYSGAYIGLAGTFYSSTSGIASDTKPYVETKFEPSPLNRVIKRGESGADWQPQGTDIYFLDDNTIKKRYEINRPLEVYLFTYDATSGNITWTNNAAGYYAQSQLTAKKTIDEHGNDIVEYADKEGRTVCKKVKAPGGDYASTYYVYDDLGNLVVVLSPEAVKTITGQ